LLHDLADYERSAAFAALRADTPGVEHRNHLNNAGAALPPTRVSQAIRKHLALEERIGGYEAADARAEAIDGVYEALAELLDCDTANVALVDSATTGVALTLSAIPFDEGDVLLTTRHDYVSNQIQYLSLQERFGIDVVRAPDAPGGGVDVDALRALVHRRRPRLVAVTHVPTNSGLVQDVEAIGRVCGEKGVPYLVDACQSIGQMPVHPCEIGADFLTASARKFLRGPRGVGFLYVSDRALDAGLEPLFPDLRGADWIADDLYQPSPTARRFESWEFAYALVLGMGAAARYALDIGLPIARDRARALAERARDGLAGVEGARVLDRGPELCAIVTVAFEGHAPGELVRRLGERRINTSELTRASAVLDFDEKEVEGALRVSPHYYNTAGEVDALVKALGEIVGGGG